MQDYRLTQVSSGLRVVTERVPSVRSVSLGYWVGTGSRYEKPNQAGISHFLEHLLFKGTREYNATDIAQAFDAIGAEINAFTAKEQTVLHSRFLDQHLERAFSLSAEMLLGPTYRELDIEREVILEEIAMYEDEPQDKVHDVFAATLFDSHPLGQSVLGSSDVVSSVSINTIDRYHSERYGPENIVVAAVGSLHHEHLVAMVEAIDCSKFDSKNGRLEMPTMAEPRALFQQKSTDQYHICLGGPGINRSDERRYALGILDSILGGAVSSRLFQSVRERRGLAYVIYSFVEQFCDSGYVGIYVGTRQENVAEVTSIITAELEELQSNPASDEELERAKENFKSRFVLAMESTQARMNRLGRSVLSGVELLDLDQIIERIDSVTVEDLAALAHEFYRPGNLSAAGIGSDSETFYSNVQSVNKELSMRRIAR